MTLQTITSPIVAAWLFALTGCAANDQASYVTPGNEAHSATLTGTSRMASLMTFERYRLLSMDDSFYPQSTQGMVKVDPGAHRVVVAATFRNGFGTHVYDAVAVVNATFEKGGRYIINGKVDGTSIHAWIEESPSGRRVSDMGFGPGQAQTEAGAPFPVVIPAR